MTRLLENPLLVLLGLALFHAVWEVALLGLAAWGGLLLLRRREAKARYAFACAVLASMVGAPVATFLLLGPLGPSSGPYGFSGTAYAYQIIRDGGAGTTLLAAAKAATPWAALLWALGATLMVLRLGGGLWWLNRRYVASSGPAPALWEERARRLCRRMGVLRAVRLRVARGLDSPLVIGWLKPVILVPSSAFLHLTPEALEAVLAHEIAHVRRSDFFANLLQSLAEALLFFHPAAWWLSGHVRELREHCCDDVAAGLCGDPMILAEGLAALERLRRTSPSTQERAPGLALGAAKGNLMFRIQRLFRTQDASVPSFRGLACILAAASLIGAATLAAQNTSKANPKPQPRVGADGVADFDFNRIVIVNQPDAPAYPADAKARRIQGTVVVAVTMDEKGVPEKVEALSGPEELRPTAIDYAKAWTFAPARVKGKAVKARFKIVMPFRLKPL